MPYEVYGRKRGLAAFCRRVGSYDEAMEIVQSNRFRVDLDVLEIWGIGPLQKAEWIERFRLKGSEWERSIERR